METNGRIMCVVAEIMLITFTGPNTFEMYRGMKPTGVVVPVKIVLGAVPKAAPTGAAWTVTLIEPGVKGIVAVDPATKAVHDNVMVSIAVESAAPVTSTVTVFALAVIVPAVVALKVAVTVPTGPIDPAGSVIVAEQGEVEEPNVTPAGMPAKV
jgi:hypothetical protein